jgi:CRP-like cAMP-binding protein
MDENSSRSASQYQVQCAAMCRFVKAYELPDALVMRVSEFFTHQSKQAHSVSDTGLLLELPPCLRCEVVESLTRSALEPLPLFASAEDGFMHALAQRMTHTICCPGEILVREGDIGSEMFVVVQGDLEVLVGERVVTAISAGTCFGEQSLLTEKPRSASIRAVTYCDLYRLDSEAFMKLKSEFQATFKSFEVASRLATKEHKKNRANLNNQQRSGRIEAKSGRSEPADTSSVRTDPGAADPSFNGTDTSEAAAAARSLRERLELFFAHLLIMPFSRTRTAWAAAFLLAIAYEALALPFKIVFVGDSLSVLMCTLDVLCDCVLLVDTGLRFALAYDVGGQLDTNLQSIRQRYRKTRFWPTLLSSLPFCLFLAIWPHADARALQAPRAMRLLRLLPTFGFFGDKDPQPSHLDALLQAMRSSPFDLQFTQRKLCGLLVSYVLLAHYVACAYWAVVSAHVQVEGDRGPADADDLSEWMPSAELVDTDSAVLRYMRALYFAITSLTGLGKDTVPEQVGPLVFTLCVFIMGVLCVAYLTSSIVTLVVYSDVAHASFQTKKIALLGFMSDATVEHSLVRRTHNWLEYWWQQQGAVQIDDVVGVLSPSLQLTIKHHIFEALACTAPLFAPDEQEGTVLPSPCLRFLASSIKFEVYNAAEWVLRKGLLNDRLFIISHGTAQVIRDEFDNTVLTELTKGDIFGEQSALSSSKCICGVRAAEDRPGMASGLALIVLPHDSLLHAVDTYPELARRLEEIKQQRAPKEKPTRTTAASATWQKAKTSLGASFRFGLANRLSKPEIKPPPPADGASRAAGLAETSTGFASMLDVVPDAPSLPAPARAAAQSPSRGDGKVPGPSDDAVEC